MHKENYKYILKGGGAEHILYPYSSNATEFRNGSKKKTDGVQVIPEVQMI